MSYRNSVIFFTTYESYSGVLLFFVCLLEYCLGLAFKEGVNFSQKHNYNMAKMMVFIAEQNYMFRPISAIFRCSQLHC